MSNKVNQAYDDSEVTPQAKHRQKLIEEEAKRKASLKVSEEWLELLPDYNHPKGGKIRLVKKMSNGNAHRLYLGREKQVKDLIEKYKREGIKIR